MQAQKNMSKFSKLAEFPDAGNGLQQMGKAPVRKVT
jgi:hypothetical protein